ncbi:response regulator [Deinococcus yavapaiensis]|uniref:Two-component system response regulator n=1 Tax=Deinococcus yavapaiensis KR-236 TaxID=694435 RepID=A0A318SBS0_9DEIO|nr:response regulator [Deinococcus yavapaiensis]PYE53800.1 two-component system response regulator [Deinococcus yavapaiensis KR-236]
MIPRVVLVEDNPDDVLFIRRAFHKANLKVDLVVLSDGERAVAHLSADHAVALVLLDVKLPRLSGLEVLTWLRTQPHLAVVPTVMLTSSRDARDVQGAYEAGANSYLVKPVQSAALDQLIATLGLYWLRLNTSPDD